MTLVTDTREIHPLLLPADTENHSDTDKSKLSRGALFHVYQSMFTSISAIIQTVKTQNG